MYEYENVTIIGRPPNNVYCWLDFAFTIILAKAKNADTSCILQFYYFFFSKADFLVKKLVYAFIILKFKTMHFFISYTL